MNRIATQNSRRNPERTASTASALMIGLALVTLVSLLAAGLISSFEGAVDDIFTSDYAITSQNNFSPIPISAAEAAAKTPGVEAIASVRTAEARIFDKTEFLTAVEPDSAEVLTLEWKDGSQEVFGDLGANGAFVDDDYAKDHNLAGRLARGRRDAERREAAARRPGHLRPADRRLAVRPRHVLRARPSTGPTRIRRTSSRS